MNLEFTFKDIFNNKEKVIEKINGVIEIINKQHGKLFNGYSKIGEEVYNMIIDTLKNEEYLRMRKVSQVSNSPIVFSTYTRSSGTKYYSGWKLEITCKIYCKIGKVYVIFDEKKCRTTCDYTRSDLIHTKLGTYYLHQLNRMKIKTFDELLMFLVKIEKMEKVYNIVDIFEKKIFVCETEENKIYYVLVNKAENIIIEYVNPKENECIIYNIKRKKYKLINYKVFDNLSNLLKYIKNTDKKLYLKLLCKS